MKIYTRKGDSGHTSLIDGDIVNKHNLSVDAYGTIDELNSFLGLLKDYIKDDKIKDTLNKIQIKLFSIGSILASGKNKNISEILDMTVEEAYNFFENVPTIKNKLQTLVDVGLSYIKIGQNATTLSEYLTKSLFLL